MSVRRRAAPHLPHAAHTQLLPPGGLHSGFYPKRHWSVTWFTWLRIFCVWFAQLFPPSSQHVALITSSSLHLVRPAKLPNLSISDGSVFSWSYPDSWEKPCTFFGLEFQVKVVQSGHTCDSNDYIMVSLYLETTII